MEKDALIINLYGGPGTGKSTTAAGVFSLLKLHGVDCELVTEFAKDLVWEERHRTFGNQNYIFGKQQHRLWRVKDKVDVVVTDAPLMLSVVYGEMFQNVNSNFLNTVVDTVDEFNNINVFLKRVKEYNPNGRNQTKEEAEELDLIIKTTLHDYDMTWETMPGDYTGINKISKRILKILGDKPCRIKLKEV